MTNETETKTLTQIAELAPQVAAAAAEHASAIAEEREAEAAVLERAIATAWPALAAITSRIRSRHDTTGGQNGCNPVEIEEWHPVPALALAGDKTPEKVKDETGNEGTYTGDALVLLVDGTLARRDWSGTWSSWQGAWDRLSSKLTPITARAAMDRYELETCLGSIAEALQKQANAGRRTKAAHERAARLRALATLSK